MRLCLSQAVRLGARVAERSFSSPALVQPAASSALRPYQESVVRRAVELYGQGTRRLLVPLATGLGKTVVFTHLPQAFPTLCRKGTLVLVHRDELVQQAVASFRKFLPHLSVGVEKGNETAHPGLDVVVASVQTLGRKGTGSARLRRYHDYGGVVVVDEAHHVKSGGAYDEVLNGLGVGSECRGHTRDGRLLAGFTATPKRADGLSLRPFFDYSIGGLDLQWGINNGYLVDIYAYSVKTATDIGLVPVRQQDFSGAALSHAVNNDLRNAAAARAMLEFGGGAEGRKGESKTPRGIAFCADVKHAHDLARVLNEHGISALAVDGSMKKRERTDILSAFRSGEASTLTNCGVLTEGFDAPFCNTIVMCRPTQSTPLYMQMLGRGTRPLLGAPPPPSDSGTVSGTVLGPAPAAGGSDVANCAKERRNALRKSRKPRMHVIDLVDNCGKHKVATMSSVLGLSQNFRGDGIDGNLFSVEDVGWLADEALLLSGDLEAVKAAKSPKELAMLVKHYRLLQGLKGAETLFVDGKAQGVEDAAAGGGSTASQAIDIAQLQVGDRIGKDTMVKVTVEAIQLGSDEESDHPDTEDDNGYEEGIDNDDEEDYDSVPLRQRPKRKLTRRVCNRRKRKGQPSSATVRMRDSSSRLSFVWRTAGVKDTEGGELHESEAYRLVASVRELPDLAREEVEITRCRLAPIVDHERD